MSSRILLMRTILRNIVTESVRLDFVRRAKTVELMELHWLYMDNYIEAFKDVDRACWTMVAEELAARGVAHGTLFPHDHDEAAHMRRAFLAILRGQGYEVERVGAEERDVEWNARAEE